MPRPRGAALLVLAFALAAGPAAAGNESTLRADRFTHDERANTVTAEGDVVFSGDGRILRADRMTYDQSTGRIVAEGGAVLEDADGTLYRAEAAEVSDDLLEGVLEALTARFPGGGEMTAEAARRGRDGRTEFDRAAYTRCESCDAGEEEDAGAPDLSEGGEGDAVPWRILARSVAHEPEEREIVYRNVTLEAFGLPILYVPYLRLPDPSVPRASGLLLPNFRTDDILGFVYEQPYFVTAGPHQDVLLRPTHTSREGPVLRAVWRGATANADWRVEGSITRGGRATAGTSERTTRGHADVKAAAGLGGGWEGGLDVIRASDRTYLPRYGFGRGTNVLTQYGYLRRRGGAVRADVELYGFQNISTDAKADRVPQVFPRVRLNLDERPRFGGGQIEASLDALALAQDDGRRNRRISIDGAWRAGATTPGGHVLEAAAAARGDFYRVRPGIGNGDAGASGSTSTSRFLPQIEAGWRFPLVGPALGGSLVVEPVVQALVRDRTPNPDTILNTDSHDVELTYASLFDGNRFPGLDRVEGGVRANYGLRGTFRTPGGFTARGAIGRVLRSHVSSDFEAPTGLRNRHSDIVGGLALRAESLGTAYYAFRRSPSVRGTRHDQFAAQADLGPVRGDFAYVRLIDDVTMTDGRSAEQVRAEIGWRITEAWEVSGFHLRDLSGGRGGSVALRSGLSLAFRNECLAATLSFRQERTQTPDIPPTTTIGLRFTLLGI